MIKKKASVYYEIILKTLVFITLIATAISFFGVFTSYLNLNYAARRVVREIEVSGQVTSKATVLFDELKSNMNMGDSAVMSVSASDYKESEKKIQLRDTFTVTMSSNYRINIFTPLDGEPVGINIPLSVKLTGMSEKFWK